MRRLPLEVVAGERDAGPTQVWPCQRMHPYDRGLLMVPKLQAVQDSSLKPHRQDGQPLPHRRGGEASQPRGSQNLGRSVSPAKRAPEQRAASPLPSAHHDERATSDRASRWTKYRRPEMPILERGASQAAIHSMPNESRLKGNRARFVRRRRTRDLEAFHMTGHGWRATKNATQRPRGLHGQPPQAGRNDRAPCHRTRGWAWSTLRRRWPEVCKRQHVRQTMPACHDL